MADLIWPLQGRCGACGRPAQQFPSLRWEHLDVPCLARSQGFWRVDDVDIKAALVFVPEGEPLPVAPESWHWHVKETIPGTPVPASVGICNADHSHSVREFLAAEAESRQAARPSLLHGPTNPGGGG